MKALLVTLFALFSTLAFAQTERFYGYAYDLKSGRYLYTEVHEQTLERGRWLRGSIRYYDAKNQLMGSKTLDFSRNPFVPVYGFELQPQGFSEAILSVDGNRVQMRKTKKGKTENKTIDIGQDTAADSGFHNYLLAHFDDLMQRKPFAFRFVVAGNLDAYSFRAKRVEDGEFDGRTAARFVVEPDSVLRWLVDPLQLSYDPVSKKLLEYRGISNVHDPATGKAYNARIVYPAEPPADAPKPLPALSDSGG